MTNTLLRSFTKRLASVLFIAALLNAAIVTTSLDSGLVVLTIDTGAKTAHVTNNEASRAALFNVFNAAVLNGKAIGSVIVWSYTQAANSTNTIAIPTTDNNGTAINWVVGNVTTKGGTVIQTVTSPPWQLTMQ